MRRVNLAVIGCGFIAETAHIPNAMSIPEARLVAVADVDEERLKLVEQKFGVKECHLDYHEVLSRPDVDAVLICTPTSTHAQISIEAVGEGKHVFVEKPMTMNSTEAEKVVEAVRESGVKFMVGMNHRFVPSHRIARRFVREGRIGDVVYAEAHGETLVVKPEEGALLDYGVHLVDLLCWYLSDRQPVKVAGFLHSRPGEQKDTEAVVTMLFSDGVIGQVKVVWMKEFTSWGAVDRYVKIVGTKGKIVSELTGPGFTIYREGSLMSRVRGPQKIVPRRVVSPHIPLTQAAYRLELEHFLTSIIRDRKPESNELEGLKVMRILDAAYESFREGRFVGLPGVGG